MGKSVDRWKGEAEKLTVGKESAIACALLGSSGFFGSALGGGGAGFLIGTGYIPRLLDVYSKNSVGEPIPSSD